MEKKKSSRIPADAGSLRTAVLLCGMLREFESCAASLQRHVVTPAGADLFYYGPKQQDIAKRGHEGRHDILGFLKDNPKRSLGEMIDVEPSIILETYGSALKALFLHEIKSSFFDEQAQAHVPKERWLFGLNPIRIFSMFHNLEHGVRMLLDYEKENNVRYDRIVITRPDLAFYSPISAYPEADEIHIPDGEGFDGFGIKRVGNARCFYYRNINSGDYIPGGGRCSFNDQIFVISRTNLECFLDLSKNLPEYFRSGVAASPETILYLHLVSRNNLTVETHPEWVYNIVRRGDPLTASVYDTTEIQLIDRYNPIAIALRQQRPLMTFLRETKLFLRRVKKRLLRGY